MISLIRSFIRHPRLTLTIALLGNELTRGMTSREYAQALAENARESYQERREKGSSKLGATIRAGIDTLDLGRVITEIKVIGALTGALMSATAKDPEPIFRVPSAVYTESIKRDPPISDLPNSNYDAEARLK